MTITIIQSSEFKNYDIIAVNEAYNVDDATLDELYNALLHGTINKKED